MLINNKLVKKIPPTTNAIQVKLLAFRESQSFQPSMMNMRYLQLEVHKPLITTAKAN